MWSRNKRSLTPETLTKYMDELKTVGYHQALGKSATVIFCRKRMKAKGEQTNKATHEKQDEGSISFLAKQHDYQTSKYNLNPRLELKS